MMNDLEIQPKNKFYTTGFASKDINDLKPMLDTLDAVLVDVRFSPMSDLMRWRKVYLETLLRGKYHHVPQLGGRSFREGSNLQIQNFDLGFKILLAFSTNAVLICGCADLKSCHRFLLAEKLKQKGFPAEELLTWKVKQVKIN